MGKYNHPIALAVFFSRLKKILVGLVALLGIFTSCASSRHTARTRTKGRQPASLSGAQFSHLRKQTRDWVWPLYDVAVTSQFGNRGGKFHDGIDLRAKVGTPVIAAYAGKVIYAGNRIRGYGSMVVIRHPNGLSSVYAHNSKLWVSKGNVVRRGEKIALSGNSGHSSGPHVHFEIRDGVKAVNPIAFLPSPDVVREANRRIASRKTREFNGDRDVRRVSQSSILRVKQ